MGTLLGLKLKLNKGDINAVQGDSGYFPDRYGF